MLHRETNLLQPGTVSAVSNLLRGSLGSDAHFSPIQTKLTQIKTLTEFMETF